MREVGGNGMGFDCLIGQSASKNNNEAGLQIPASSPPNWGPCRDAIDVGSDTAWIVRC